MTETQKPTPLSDRIIGWARASSLTPLVFGGVLQPSTFHTWPLGVIGPELGNLSSTWTTGQADLLVVLGHIPHKLAPVLQRTFASMADPSFVLQMAVADAASGVGHYALIERLEEIVPVDVIIEGSPPTAAALEEGLGALRKRVRGRGSAS